MAGTDSEMVSTNIRDYGAQLLAEHRISMTRLDDAVRRIFRVKFRAGLFDHPYVDQAMATDPASFPTGGRPAGGPHGGRQVDGAAEERQRDPAVRPEQEDRGDRPARGQPSRHAGPLVGTRRRSRRRERARRLTSQSPGTTFAQACTLSNEEPPAYDPADDCTSADGFAEAVAAAESADQVVLALGETREMSGEAASRSTLDLPGRQQEPIDAIKATGRPFAVVLFNGRPLTLGDVRELARGPGGLVPRRRGRQRGRRPGLRQGQPGRQAAGLVPAAGRSGADLLQPPSDRPPLRRRREVRLALPRPAHVRPAVRRSATG